MIRSLDKVAIHQETTLLDGSGTFLVTMTVTYAVTGENSVDGLMQGLKELGLVIQMENDAS